MSKLGQYPVGKPLGKPDHRFRLYECGLPDELNHTGILKIASEIENNGELDREALALQMMRKEAARLEGEYAKVKKKPEYMMNYQFFFPNLVDTFVCEEQGGRRVNILSFEEIANEREDLVPIAHIVSRDRVRVDPRTSGWILGKLLKLLVFTHPQGISGNLLGSNILLNRQQHYVSVFDWTEALLGDAPVSEDVAREEISQVAREVTLVLGGDPETGEIPPDAQLEDGRYQEFLSRLVDGEESDAGEAHRQFYELIDELWPRGFHKWSTYSLV